MVLSGIWEEFLKIAKEEAGSRVVDTWFKAVSLHQWDSRAQVVYLQAPNAFVRDWVQTHYLPLIQTHMGRLLHVQTPKIIITIQGASADAPLDYAVIQPAILVPEQVIQKPVLRKTIPQKNFTTLNAAYSFETFIVGPHNSLAYAAAHAIAQNPGRLYNPFFIYGESGLGKTHLLHAIGNAIRLSHPSAMVMYQTTDRFVNEFINAIRFNKVHIFQQKYKNIDVLLIDDVQFISNKEQTQEAFFHIFNALFDAHKQLVLSSDTYPQNLAGIAQRLRSRLASGLIADIHMPSTETKIAILKKKADMSGTQLSDEVAHYIVSCSFANVRELEGALIRVIAFATLTKQAITVELAQRVLARLHEPLPRHQVVNDFDRIIRCVQKYFSYSVSDLRSKVRAKDVSYVRQIAMFLMKKGTNKSLRDIGEFLGGRDHSTVMHAVTKIEMCIATDSEFAARIKQMEHELGF